MTQYILDTDHITLLQHSNPLILQRFETLHTSDVAITVINVEELIQGWFNAIRQASQPGQKQRLTWAYLDITIAKPSLCDISNFCEVPEYHLTFIMTEQNPQIFEAF